MRRIVLCAFDSKFFELFGAIFIKSFFEHNKKWTMFTIDIGLEDEQRNLLLKYGPVKQYAPDPSRRWLQMTARFQAWSDIIQPDDILWNLDVDQFFSNSLSDNAETGAAQQLDILCSATQHRTIIRDKSRLLKLLSKYATIVPERLPSSRIGAACLFLFGTAKTIKMLRWLKEDYEEWLACASDEESALSFAAYALNLNIGYKDFVLEFAPVDQSSEIYIIPSTRPVLFGKKVNGIHFATTKYYLLNSACGNTHEQFMAWKDVFKEYERLAWPEGV